MKTVLAVVKSISFHVLQVGMRSRNQGGESSSNGHVSCPKSSIISNAGDKGPSEEAKKNKANRKEDDVTASGTVKRHLKPSRESEKKTKKTLELSKEDLIQLLSIMEGELQVETDSSGHVLLAPDLATCPSVDCEHLWEGRAVLIFLIYA